MLSQTFGIQRKVPLENAQQFANNNNLMFMETSALSKDQVDQALRKLLENVHRNNPQRYQAENTQRLREVTQTPQKQSSSCC
ncbi:ras gtpase [Stylonychia lemnae]|uniref:Ras gtpase n=1 Tax=Stylonychia lemnae TaxID=5949 RepID=A0A078AMA9_STYLE|nr:ras gtpase [Stylonychia lemnae]|eukprot:CDW83036.1 ras gtpase [Stylonychia lemnae]